jgi:hypothetical protein
MRSAVRIALPAQLVYASRWYLPHSRHRPSTTERGIVEARIATARGDVVFT